MDQSRHTPDALLRTAGDSARAGNRSAAIATIAELCRRHPNDIRGWVQLSYHRIADRDYRRALEAATEALRLDPDDAGALINAGVASYGLEDFEAAHNHLERAVRIDPSDPFAWLELGRTLTALGRSLEAIDAHVRALDADRLLGDTPARRRGDADWVIGQAIDRLAESDCPTPPEQPLRSLCDGTRLLVSGKLIEAYRHIEHARDSPCELDMPTVRAAATTLLAEVWRRHARMTPAPEDGELGKRIDFPQQR